MTELADDLFMLGDECMEVSAVEDESDSSLLMLSVCSVIETTTEALCDVGAAATVGSGGVVPKSGHED